MTESKVYELLHELIGECWEWAYDKPENAVAYFDGAYTMAQKVIENLEPDFELEATPNGLIFRKLHSIAYTDCFNGKGKEVST